jgi:hypothetical protein
MSHVTLPRMRELSPAPTLVAKNKRGLLSEWPSYWLVLQHLWIEHSPTWNLNIEHIQNLKSHNLIIILLCMSIMRSENGLNASLAAIVVTLHRIIHALSHL